MVAPDCTIFRLMPYSVVLRDLFMHNRVIRIAASLALILACGFDSSQAVKSGIAIVPNGTDSTGSKLYNVRADSAEITTLLKELFKITGDQFTVDQDVAGPVDLNLKSATIQEVIKEVAKLTKPPLRIVKQGAVYRVSREFSPQAAANAVRDATGDGLLQAMRPPAGGFGQTPNPYQALAPANRPVTLDIPKDRPIALADALAR